MSRIPQLVLDKKARDGKDYKNIEIAEAIDLSPAMVSRFMRDLINVESAQFGTMIAWANWLEVDLIDLVEHKS